MAVLVLQMKSQSSFLLMFIFVSKEHQPSYLPMSAVPLIWKYVNPFKLISCNTTQNNNHISTIHNVLITLT